MDLKTIESINTDVLVIGGGLAGLRAAIEARKYGLEVALASESPAGFRNNSAISKATFAASGIWKQQGDSPELHLHDTVASGCLINDRTMVEAITQGAAQQVYDLMNFGVSFRKRGEELLALHLPGHSCPRHVSGETLRGIDLTRPMRRYAESAGVQIIEGVLITKLLSADGVVVGALGITRGNMLVINAKSTILATGGAGQLYLRTNNALGLTGDGYAIAYQAGASLRDMEFVQFYPTAWGKHGTKIYLYEWFLPRGATIRDSLGADILKRRGMDEFASVTRDLLTRIIMEEIVAGRGIEGTVLFDFTTMPQEEVKRLHRARMLSKEAYPENVQVAPTAHFFMGGVVVNVHGETGVDGLYAAGEVCGGSHGANRLGGNAISETLVFGMIAGHRAASRALKMDQELASRSGVTAEVERLASLASGGGKDSLNKVQQSLKQTMWDKVGVIRNGRGLQDALQEILALQNELRSAFVADYRGLCDAVKLANMLTVAEMVCRAALMRTETRGAHYRTDYPEKDDQRWLKTIQVSCKGRGMTLRVLPVKLGLQ